MNKLFTLLTILAFTGFSFITKAQLVSHNAQTTINGDPSTVLVGQVTITNTSNSSVSIKVRRTKNNCSSGHDSYFCWGTNCYPPTTSSSPTFVLLPDSSSLLLADADPQGTNGIDSVSYIVYDVNDSAGDKLSFDFTYDFATGINVLHAPTDFMICSQPATQDNMNVSYSISNFKNGKLIIRNLLGSIVKEIPLYEKQGMLTVATYDMPVGIYMYFLYNNNEPIISRKTLVSHN